MVDPELELEVSSEVEPNRRVRLVIRSGSE